jgi:hypothetical protein
VKWVERAKPPIFDGDGRKIASGERHHTLYKAACLMAKIIFERGLGTDGAMTLLMGACWTNGLIRDDGREACRATIADAFRAVEEDILDDRLALQPMSTDVLDEVAAPPIRRW